MLLLCQIGQKIGGVTMIEMIGYKYRLRCDHKRCLAETTVIVEVQDSMHPPYDEVVIEAKKQGWKTDTREGRITQVFCSRHKHELE